MFFHVFRKIKIRKLHISTFFMNFYIFSKFVVLTRVGTGSEHSIWKCKKHCGSYPGRSIPFQFWAIKEADAFGVSTSGHGFRRLTTSSPLTVYLNHSMLQECPQDARVLFSLICTLPGTELPHVISNGLVLQSDPWDILGELVFPFYILHFASSIYPCVICDVTTSSHY